MKNLSINISITFIIYLLLTLPHFLAIITMDLDTGEYFGYVYPLWVIITISMISVVSGIILGRKFNKNINNGK